MELTDPQRHALTERAREVAAALDDISRTARERLDQASPVVPRDVVALPINPMTTKSAPLLSQIGQALRGDRQALSRLAREPFVARVVVADETPEQKRTVFYISRGPVAGIDVDGARLVNYGAALGRLAELRPGASFRLRTASGGEQKVIVDERVTLRPVPVDGTWEATDSSFETEDWHIVLVSLRRLLEQAGVRLDDVSLPDILGELLQQQRESELLREKARRALIENISLRDQPILDTFQGEIFRLPLNRKLLLLGPPGTGKTTTMIRRLAHKRTVETLSEDERDLLERRGLTNTFFQSQGWAMFAPTDLLKLYLRDAFNREGIPATDNNLRTWAQERLHLGRNVLGILRSAERHGFQLDDVSTPLAGIDSATGTRLFDRFNEFAGSSMTERLADALGSLKDSDDSAMWSRVGALVPSGGTPDELPRTLSRVLERADAVQPDIKRLEDEIDSEVRRIGNRLLNQHRSLVEELTEALTRWAQEGADEGVDGRDDDTDELDSVTATPVSPRPTAASAAQALLDAIRVFARGVASGRISPRGRAGMILALLGNRAPSRDDVSQLGALLKTRQHLRAVVQAPRTFVMSMPSLYARFRRESSADGSLFRSDVSEWIRSNRISGPELDVVILTMLRHARRLLQPESLRGNLAMSANHAWLEDIRSQYVPQLFVDEATDFSAVQLGCLTELAHPSLRSWFACGDFMQRVTAHGIASPADIAWLERLDGEAVDVRNVSIGYRQSDKLRALVVSLTESVGGTPVHIDSPEHEHPDGVAPILAEHTKDTTLATWLAARIVEVESRLGLLPSIAVFVDGDDRIAPLVETLKPLLAAHNLPIVGCPGGRVVGDDREIRVFDVRFIKGLEFEAVFFVAVDRLQESLGSLFRHLFYVGASRAATYLAVTAEGDLPNSLASVRHHFTTGAWNS